MPLLHMHVIMLHVCATAACHSPECCSCYPRAPYCIASMLCVPATGGWCMPRLCSSADYTATASYCSTSAAHATTRIALLRMHVSMLHVCVPRLCTIALLRMHQLCHVRLYRATAAHASIMPYAPALIARTALRRARADVPNDPAAGSPTATLLRLTSYPGAEARGSPLSPRRPSEIVTGGVYKLQGHIHRGLVSRRY